MDFALFQHLPDDLAAIYTAGLFIVTQPEQDRALRAVPLLEQRLRRLHDADQLVLDVQRAPPPDEAIDDLAIEWRVRPLGRVGGDDILVRHQHHRFQIGAGALPDVDQAVPVYDLTSQFLVYQRIGILKHLVQLLECLRFRRAAFVHRDSLAAYRRRQVLCHLLFVHGHAFDFLCCAVRPLEDDRAHHDICSGKDQESQDDVKNILHWIFLETGAAHILDQCAAPG